MKKKTILAALFICFFAYNAYALSEAYKNNIYNPGELKPVDSVLKVKVGQKAPDFTLKAVSGKMISLKDYRGQEKCCNFFCARGVDTGLFRSVARLQYCSRYI